MPGILTFLQDGIEGTQHVILPKRAVLSVPNAHTFVVTRKGKTFFTAKNVSKLQLTQKGLTFDIPSITGDDSHSNVDNKPTFKNVTAHYVDGSYYAEGEHYKYTWTDSLRDIRVKHDAFILTIDKQMYYLGTELKLTTRQAHFSLKASAHDDESLYYTLEGMEMLRAGFTTCKVPSCEGKEEVLPTFVVNTETLPSYVEVSDLESFDAYLLKTELSNDKTVPVFLGGTYNSKRISKLFSETHAAVAIIAHGGEISIQADGFYYLPKGKGLVKGYKIPHGSLVAYSTEDGNPTYQTLDISNPALEKAQFKDTLTFLINVNDGLMNHMREVFPQA